MPAQKAKRFEPIDPAQYTPEQKLAAERVLAVKGRTTKGVVGPYIIYLRSPAFAGHLMNMGNYLRLETSVPRALNEFVIMIQCRIRACNFAFWAHARLGREFGVKDEIIADLEAGRRPQAMSELEVATFDFCTELELRNRVCETTYAKLKSHLSDQQIVDLTSVFGFYAMTSMALNLNETEITEDGVVAFDPDVVPFQAA